MERNETVGRGWVLMLAATVAVAGCAPPEGNAAQAQQDGMQEAAPMAEAGGARVLNVEVEPVALRSFTDFIRITGEVEALHDVTVSAEEAGTIARFAGELLAALAAAVDDLSIDTLAHERDVATLSGIHERLMKLHRREMKLHEEIPPGSRAELLLRQAGRLERRTG